MQIFLSLFVLCGVASLLTLLLLTAESYFLDYGECKIKVGEKTLVVIGGQSLLRTLGERKIFLPSACGGKGACGVCKCKVINGAGPLLPTETPYLSDRERKENVRLSCQVKVKQDIEIQIPPEILDVKDFQTTVTKITDLTHDIKGVRFQIPEGEKIDFKAGQFVNFVTPPYGDIDSPTPRAYSIASSPSEKTALELIIRLVPNGICTSFVFEHLKENDPIQIIGPFGEFFLRDSDREIICIAGGSGLGPIRSILLDMIDRGISQRKTTFFFGAVNLKDIYYVEEFSRIQQQHSWFSFVPALSGNEEGHSFERGIITEVVARHYETLDNHEAYLCGSPGMINACIQTLSKKGLPESQIFYDKFA